MNLGDRVTVIDPRDFRKKVGRVVATVPAQGRILLRAEIGNVVRAWADEVEAPSADREKTTTR